MDNNKNEKDTAEKSFYIEPYSSMVSDLLLNIYSTISLPTKKTQAKSLILSGIILLASTVSKLLGLVTLIEPLGALLCFTTLLILSIKEEDVRNELSGMYSAIMLSFGKVTRGSASAGKRQQARRNTNDRSGHKQKAGK